jgi:hypothetical protein
MMDRVVTNLVDGLREVNDAMRRMRDARTQRGEVHVTELVRLAENILKCRPLSRPDEELARGVLLTMLQPLGTAARPGQDPMVVGPERFAAQPDLLRLLGGQVAPARPGEEVRFEQLEPGVQTAALLLAVPEAGPHGAEPTWRGVAERLRELRRYDLLGLLFGELPDADRQDAVQQAQQTLVDLRGLSAAARRVWRDLEDLAVPQHRQVLEAIAAAEGHIDGAGSQPSADARLLKAWLERLLGESARMREEAVSGWTASIRSEGGPDSEARLRAMAEQRWGDATRTGTKRAEVRQ